MAPKGGGGPKTFEVKGPCIGIDLGTHSSAVAVLRSEAPSVVANAQGSHTTPSVVAFVDAEQLVGEVAVQQAVKNASNTVVEAKRLLGRRHDDEDVKKDAARWRFALTKNDGKACVQVQFKGAASVFTPEALCGMVISNLKSSAEAFVHAQVKNCVLAAPIYWNDEQRAALAAAASSAGLTVLRILSEPVAAAMAYDLDKPTEGSKTVAVFNMGSRTCDVSILSVQNGLMRVLGSAEDLGLGGADVDETLVNMCVKDFLRKNKLDPTESHRSLAKIRTACEAAKIQLSQATNAKVSIESAHEGYDLNCAVSRARFDEMNSALFARILPLVGKALETAKVTVEDIDQVILVGGPMRIPKVQALVQQAFPGKELSTSIPPEEAVAIGAAIQAERLMGSTVSSGHALDKTVDMPVTPRAIFVGVEGGAKAQIFPAGTPLPCEEHLSFGVADPSATAALIHIYEGTEKDSQLVSTLSLNGVDAPPIAVTIQIAEDGNLTMHAKDASGMARHNMTVGPCEE